MARRTKYRTVKGTLSVWGWIPRIVLLVGTIATIIVLVVLWQTAGDATSYDERHQATSGMGTIVFLWLAGAVVFGAWAFLTRAPRAVVPVDDDT